VQSGKHLRFDSTTNYNDYDYDEYDDSDSDDINNTVIKIANHLSGHFFNSCTVVSRLREMKSVMLYASLATFCRNFHTFLYSKTTIINLTNHFSDRTGRT